METSSRSDVDETRDWRVVIPENGAERRVLAPDNSLVRTAGRDERPIVDVSGGDLHQQANDAWWALVTANDPVEPSVLVRGSDLVFVGRDEGERDASVTLKRYVKASLRDRLSRVARFGVPADDGEWSFRKPPVDVAEVLLERDASEYRDAPRVNRVVDVPVFGADGTLITTPGYHAASRTYYAPARQLDRVPDISTDQDSVQEARRVLCDELLGDFAFVDAADLANAIGLLVLPFVRELIDGPTPLHAIIAHEVGTGKSLLADALLIPACGRVPRSAEPGDANEYRKVITALLLQGPSAIVFDNLRQKLDSGPLANALTSERWSDRILGYSKVANVPIRNAWVATVNNLDLNTEQARRIVPIYLDAGVERPWERGGFRHPNLLDWARTNRRELVWAALTLIQNWLEGEELLLPDEDGDYDYVRTGRRLQGSRMLGSYENWSKVVGGILAAAGIGGHLDNLSKLYETADADRDETAAFVEAWFAHTQEPLKLSDLMQLLDYGAALRDALPSELRGIPLDKLHARMSYFLRSNHNRIFNGLKIAQATGTKTRWYVDPVDG